MFLSYGARSKCCYAPIRMGKKKIKNTKREVSIWICCKCGTKDVDVIEYNKNGPPKSTFAEVDKDEPDMVE